MDMAVLPREYEFVYGWGRFVRGARFGEDSPDVENGEKSLIKELIFLAFMIHDHALLTRRSVTLKREFLSCVRRSLSGSSSAI